MNVSIHLIKAFTTDGASGNPAGVIHNAEMLTDEHMLKIARILGFSETAFVFPSDTADFKLRFFAPKREMDFCGHATIATFHSLLDRGILHLGPNGTTIIAQETRAGTFPITCYKDGKVMMAQHAPEFGENEADRTRIAALLGIREQDLSDLPIQVIATVVPKLIIPLRSLEALRNVQPDFVGISKYTRSHPARGFYVFTSETASGHTDFAARAFNPHAGIHEDSATGAAAGPLGCYADKYIFKGRKNIFLSSKGLTWGWPAQCMSIYRPACMWAATAWRLEKGSSRSDERRAGWRSFTYTIYMELIVDLHVHSHYSRATSRSCTIEGLYFWGKKKGINIIGTGDFTHPQWFNEFREKLEPAEGGLFALKRDVAEEIDKTLPVSVRNNLIRFVPTVEIATIYKKGEKVRKLHQLVVMPSFEAVSRLNTQLERIGNLKADGRPILGLDSKELLRLSLEADPEALYIPAHIWTPWFGLFGSKSGFDTIAEAFDELAPEIKAIETGLSSDPHMNARLSQLDGIAVTSHSDAHSPQKLGREATIVQADPSYPNIIGAIKTNDHRLKGSIEFFPEEGKYHADGHRLCGVRLMPEETKAHGGMCPQCNKPLVVGVNYRVNELADRGETIHPKQVEYIIPLAEVVAELAGSKSTAGKRVSETYDQLIAALGDEFSILRTVPLDRLQAHSPEIALAVERIRAGQVHREPGYDGVYGQIKVFKDASEKAHTLNQLSLL